MVFPQKNHALFGTNTTSGLSSVIPIAGINNNLKAQHAIDEEIERYQLINEGIERYKAIIRGLLTRRNTYAEISRLPQELMAQIFIIAASTSRAKWYDFGVTPTLMIISSVCTQWWRIALGTPQLWDSISTAKPRACAALLERSKASPLKIFCPLPHQSDEDFAAMVTALTAETARFKEARIQSSIDNAYSALALFLHPKLWGCHPIKTSNMPNLTDLLVQTNGPGNRLSIPWMINLLRNTPLLEELEIDHISSDFSIAVAGELPVSLPKLRSMKLHFQYIKEAQLFSYLEIPSSTQSTIEFHNDDPEIENEDFCYLQTFVESHISHGTPFLNVETQNLLTLFIAHLPPLTQLSLSPPGPLTWDKIHNLTLEGVVKHDEVLAWSNFLPHLVNIKTIQVERVTILRSLAVHNCSLSASEMSVDVCYNLEEVCVHGDKVSTAEEWLHFLRICQTRYDHGKPLREVSLYCCNIPQEYLEQFGGVTELECDGSDTDEVSSESGSDA
ncbi:hypothetical protein ONZ45_g11957 [Pleurotus djamor]|nr:hypothetical protein ONZ45_g11957 [Pleurotus djamor]